MEFSTITFIPQELVNAIGSTLIHSLWQGLVLAAVTGLIVVFTRKHQPTTRYKLLIGAMAIFFISILITFFNAFDNHIQLIESTVANPIIENGAINVVHADVQEVSLLVKTKNYLNNHHQILVMIWLLIVCARCVQLSIGLNRLGYLRRTAVFEVDDEWKDKIAELAKKLGITQIIGIAESHLTKVPLVIGHLKPLILIPVGLLTAIQPKQIEAIIIHELAHIYRRDYLVNILQSFMEIMFFFNPAVLWLSALIRTERENCCDDIAIKETSSKINYISALVSCQEYQLAAPDFAMAFSKKGELKSRVQRLVYNSNQSLNKLEKSLLALCIVAVGFGLLAFSNVKKIGDIIVDNKSTVQQTSISLKQDSLKRLKEIQKLQSKTDQTNAKSINIATSLQQDSLKRLIALHKLQSKTDQENTESVTTTTSTKTTKTVREEKNEKVEKTEPIIERTIGLSDTFKSLKAMLPLLNVRINMPIGQLKAQVPSPPVPPKTSTPPVPPKASIGDQVTQELLKDGIISKGGDQLSFMLSEKEMVVNGKSMSNDVHKKYKDKYVPVMSRKNTWTLYHNYETKTTTTTTP